MRKRKKQENENRWFSMPRALFQDFSSALDIHSLAVYGLLAAYADKSFSSKLNYHKVSQKLGCTNAEAVRALHKLEDLHLIKSELDNSKTMNYRLLWVHPWGKLGEKMAEMPSPFRIELSFNNKYDNDIEGFIRRIIFKQRMNQSEETQLAYELAEALNDKEAIQMYISYVHRFPEGLLREMLIKVLSIPENKIRKTRGALFNYLIQQHAAKSKYYPRD
jgi:hypothetical protein